MSSSSQKKSVCLMGGGVAGLAAAVFLDAHGFSVTLVEKKPILGGRTYSFKEKKTTFDVDNGQHLMMGAYHETLRFLDMVGSGGQILRPSKNKVALYNASGEVNNFLLSSIRPPLNALLAFWRYKPFLFKDKLGLLKIRKSLKNHDPKKFNKSTIAQWLIDIGQSQKARDEFWEPFTLATLNEPTQTASVHHLLTILQRAFLGEANDSQFLIPKGSLNQLIVNPARTFLELRGHKVLTATAAKHLHILDNKVRELECSDGSKIKADYFISALTPNHLLKIIPAGFIQSLCYFSDIKKLTYSPITSINLWFDKPLFDDNFIGTTHLITHWLFNKNKIGSFNGPPYHYVAVVSASQDWLDKSGAEIKELIVKDINKLFPNKNVKLLHSLVNKEREATIRHIPENEIYRPQQISPFENFYVIGDWTQTYLPATIESASVSAKIATHHILNS